MKLRQTITLAFALQLVFLFNACGNQSSKSENMQVAELQMASEDESLESMDVSAESSYRVQFTPPQLAKEQQRAVGFVTSKAASSVFDGDKKFIRTANLHFSVKDVLVATHRIEDIVIAQKGFIISSSVSNVVQRSDETRITKDSVLIRSHNLLQGDLTLRVQHELLDATLREIALTAEEVQHRTVSAKEVTFDIFANNLEQQRKKDKAARVKNISGAGKGHKLENLLSAEEAIDDARAATDAALVEEKKMYDQIEYSIITISIWQSPTVMDKIEHRPVEVESIYRESFWSNVVDAAADGWYGLLAVVELLIYIWPLILIVVGLIYLIIHVRRKKKRKQQNQ